MELAKVLDGEIINADSVQLYRGLDIASARISPPEMNGIPHHLLGCFSPGECVTASTYRDLALSVIADIKNRRKIPILVGGTNYYIERVLFGEDTCEQSKTFVPIPKCSEDGKEEGATCLHTDVVPLWPKLSELDAEAASLIHPNDSRRVQKALSYFKTSVLRKCNLLYLL